METEPTNPEIEKLEATVQSKLNERDKLMSAPKPDFARAAELDHEVEKHRREIALRRLAEQERRDKEAKAARAKETASKLKTLDALLSKRKALGGELNKAIDHFVALYKEVGELNAEIQDAAIAPPPSSPSLSPFFDSKTYGPIRERMRKQGAEWACKAPLEFKPHPPDLVEIFTEQNKLFRLREEAHVSQTEAKHVA